MAKKENNKKNFSNHSSWMENKKKNRPRQTWLCPVIVVKEDGTKIEMGGTWVHE